MSSTQEVDTKLEAYKLVHDPTRLLSLLFQNMATSKKIITF